MNHTFKTRSLITCGIIITGLLATTVSAHAKTAFHGVWLFDKAPPTPGVTMMQIKSKGSKLSGSVTTKWYGPVEMLNPRIEKGILYFDARNINDRAHPSRQWTVKLTGGKVALKGQIWESVIDSTGYRGSKRDARARAFKFAPLPPLGAAIRSELAPTPPMGWSSWNKFAEHIDDKTVRAMADAMVEMGLRDAGYTYINIDDGWQGERDASGRLQPNAKFPDMKALTDYVHSKGLKIGIYSSQGPRTCAGYEGSYGHVKQDAQSFADWGFDYLKYDLCSGEWFYADADTVKRSYYEMAAALRATGRDIIFSLCEYGRFDVGSWGRDVGGQLWRTTGDITDDYATMAKIGFDHNGKPEHTVPHGFNDPDMLEVGNGGMTTGEYRTHLTLWAMSAAPLILGHDLRQTDSATLSLLTNRRVIAVDQDKLAVQGRAVRKADGLEVWAKPLADGRVAIALFNRSEKAATMSATAADAGLTTVRSVEDLWSGQSSAALANQYDVPAHGSIMLVVSGDRTGA